MASRGDLRQAFRRLLQSPGHAFATLAALAPAFAVGKALKKSWVLLADRPAPRDPRRDRLA